MKIRQDFVTNSSSSSFVIAVKKNTSKKRLEAIFEKYFKAAAQDGLSYWDEEGDDIDDLKHRFVTEFTSKNSFDLDEWDIYFGTASSEDGAFLYALYSTDDVKEKDFKFESRA